MQTQSDLARLYRIARYYYKDGLSQSEIAKRENLSRSQISRLLEKVRKLGIVKITVSLPPDLNLSELSSALEKDLGLEKVVIAPLNPSGINDNSRVVQAIATAAAEYIPEAIDNYKYIGIGWGKTLYETSLQLPYVNKKGPYCFLPLVGISGNDNPNLQINTIIDRFSEKFKSQALFINIPTIRESVIPLSKIEKSRLEELRKLWEKIDVAIIGLGCPPDKSDNLISELSDDFIKKLSNSKTCGDILSQFFYEDGRILEYGEGYTNIAYEIYRLKKVKSVICLAGGVDKVKGIITAARCGFIKTLVTDSMTARLILEQL